MSEKPSYSKARAVGEAFWRTARTQRDSIKISELVGKRGGLMFGGDRQVCAAMRGVEGAMPWNNVWAPGGLN